MKIVCNCCKQEVSYLVVNGEVKFARCACVIPPSIPLEVLDAVRVHVANPHAVGSLCSLDPKCYERPLPCPHHVETSAPEHEEHDGDA